MKIEGSAAWMLGRTSTEEEVVTVKLALCLRRFRWPFLAEMPSIEGRESWIYSRPNPFLLQNSWDQMERIFALMFGEKRKEVAIRYWRLMRFQWSLYALGEGRSHPRGCTRVSVSYCCRRHLEEVLSCQCELEGEAFSTHTLSFILLPTWLRNGGQLPYWDIIKKRSVVTWWLWVCKERGMYSGQV